MAKKKKGKAIAKVEIKDTANLPGFVPPNEEALQKQIVKIVEIQRELAATRESLVGEEAKLADAMVAAKVLQYKYHGYVAVLRELRSVKVRAIKQPKPRRRKTD